MNEIPVELALDEDTLPPPVPSIPVMIDALRRLGQHDLADWLAGEAIRNGAA